MKERTDGLIFHAYGSGGLKNRCLVSGVAGVASLSIEMIYLRKWDDVPLGAAACDAGGHQSGWNCGGARRTATVGYIRKGETNV